MLKDKLIASPANMVGDSGTFDILGARGLPTISLGCSSSTSLTNTSHDKLVSPFMFLATHSYSPEFSICASLIFRNVLPSSKFAILIKSLFSNAILLLYQHISGAGSPEIQASRIMSSPIFTNWS